MDAIGFLQLQFAALRQQSNKTLTGITGEQLKWTPPGTANSIGVILLHAIAGEDLFLQKFIQEKQLLWETQGWGERFGLALPPGGPIGWEEARQADLTPEAIQAYQQAVCEATSAFLASLTTEMLDRPAPFFGSEQPLALLLAVLICHTSEHLGEIGLLKGIHESKVSLN